MHWLLAVIVAAGSLARIGVMTGGLGRLDDPDNYLPLARSVAIGNGFELNGRPTAKRPPLYPLLLVPMVATLPRTAWPWGIGALHVLLGAGSVILTAAAARRWGYSEARTLAAAAIVAFDPVLAVQSRAVMTETLAAFLVAATLAGLSVRGSLGPILGGVGFGLASLCRPSLLAPAVMTVVAAIASGPGGPRLRTTRAVLLMLATTATLAPWAWRNHRAVGEPVWTTTHGGYTMALANNPAYYADVLDGPLEVWSGPNQDVWGDDVNRATRGMTEPEADRWFRDSTWKLAGDRPSAFGRATLARLGRFWGLAPSGAVYPWWLRAATAAWTTPLWLALIRGLARPGLWRWPEIAGPSVLLALTLVHTVYWTDLRMRAPLVPAIALIATGTRLGKGKIKPTGTDQDASGRS